MKQCKMVLDGLAKPSCGKNICCLYCEEKNSCKESCEDVNGGMDCEEQVEQETELQVMQDSVPEALKEITEITIMLDALKKQEEIFRQKILDSMVKNGIKKFENKKVTFTYVEPTTKKTFDKTAFSKAHPEINLAEYDKVSPVKESLRIKIK